MKNALILLDIQQEYTTPGRAFYLNGIETSLNQCKKLLQCARENQWEIVHMQHSNGENSERFNPNSQFYKFAQGFEPIANNYEHHFIKKNYSCYSSLDFSDYMDKMIREGVVIYLAGYNSVMCCLSTLETAILKNHPMNFIADASLAKKIDHHTEAEMHKIMCSIYDAKSLATITDTDTVIRSD